MKTKVLSVSEVNNYLKKTIDNDIILSNLYVKGEISNLKYHSSGHIYFSLKDSSSKINCVMFKGRATLLTFRLKEGMNVIITGKASLYPATGSLQIYCDDIEEEGVGKLYIEFEKLKKKLEGAGYFDNSAKKPIPKMPQRIGVVTSITGAAVRDIINVSRRRNSFVDLVLFPAKVQGEGAYKEVIEGIRYFNQTNSVNTIIIGRGGGSIEELWNFNEEELALAIFKSKIPIISAVGHEVDFTISDFVSDMRAATPSQAAEIAMPLESEIREKINYINDRFKIIITNKIETEKTKVKNIEKVLSLNSPLNKIVNSYLELDKLSKKLNLSIKNKVEFEKERLKGYNNLLMARNPANLLNKGYAIIEEKGKLIKSIENLKKETEITINFSDGKIDGLFKPKV